MPWNTSDLPDLRGRTAVVTGGNGGLGFETARALCRKGAQVILACRALDKAEAAAERIRAETPSAQIEVQSLDLASLASVRSFATRVLVSHGQLHALVNNAGVMAVPRMLTIDGFEMQLGVNHFGHFALTGLLLERLLATPGSRVVTVSSLASRIGTLRWDDLDGARSYDKWLAYGQSKLANLLFAFELARRLGAKGSTTASLACHPGYAATNLQYVGPMLEGSTLTRRVMQVGNGLFAQSAEAGALPILYALTSIAARNGDFIGPKGPGEFWGAPGHVKARKAAYNPELMQRLWQLSTERTGVDFRALA